MSRYPSQKGMVCMLSCKLNPHFGLKYLSRTVTGQIVAAARSKVIVSHGQKCASADAGTLSDPVHAAHSTACCGAAAHSQSRSQAHFWLGRCVWTRMWGAVTRDARAARTVAVARAGVSAALTRRTAQQL